MTPAPFPLALPTKVMETDQDSLLARMDHPSDAANLDEGEGD
jgi:hypothetical protein